MIIKLRYILLFILIFSFSISFSQSVSKLKNERKNINRDIVKINNLLKQVSKNKNLTSKDIYLVNKQISNREALVSNIQSEINILNSNIITNRKAISRSKKRLEILRKQYAAIIYNSWLHKSSKKNLVFILSSKDFNQAYMRLKYLKQYTKFSNKLTDDIISLNTSLEKDSVNLNSQLKSKTVLYAKFQKQKNNLLKEKRKLNRYLSSININLKSLKKKLSEQLKAQKRLNSKIKLLLAEAAKRKSRNTYYNKKLNKRFVYNKGKLPWPTKNGYISSSFGVHRHPIAKKTKVRNDGIDITTKTNSNCYAIFNGVVSEVFFFPGLNNIVMVRHGSYLTVYANLSKVYIKKGQKLKIGTKIGKIYTDDSDHKTILKFQIWKNSTKLNPSRWIRR
ncbi:MAG: peptidoglycan DD-metalloendopeptidase family protein [Marinifilaceae bacterium]|jgi:septal ring factor EnvC (AmiA/AmiB activator)|nr:peptidoglycan DD-metalloendopeptidase family protein [Marinifilaceae bacterium]